MNSRSRRPPALPKHLKEFIKTVIWKDIIELREGLFLANLANAYDSELGMLPFARYRNCVYSNDRVTKYTSEFYYEGNHYRTFEELLLQFDKDHPKYIKRQIKGKFEVCPQIMQRIREAKKQPKIRLDII